MLTAKDLREKFLNFFRENGHTVISSASLIPENDPTALFISAGMHPLVPYLLGEKHPAGKRLADIQKCVRTGDINEVGDTYHHTFLEMLGNWSLGDYFKKQAIDYSWEFLTSKKWLGLDLTRLAVTVFAGDKDAPYDQESHDIWLEIGMPEERIKKMGKEENWWGPVGDTGPCGPDTEIFYWVSEDNVPKKFDPADKRWVEVWNNVFMQYNKTASGYTPLAQKNIDTGMGFERLLAALNGFSDNYHTELFLPLIREVEKISGKKYDEDNETDHIMRIIADHVRAAVMILGDDLGVVPSNLDQGYILRRLIRRAVRYARLLGIDLKTRVTIPLAAKAVEIMKSAYPELERNKDRIFEQLEAEEARFELTLEKGLREFEKSCRDKKLSPKEAFVLFSTYGFPFEMTCELAREKGINVDKKCFMEEFQKHQELSRAGAEQKFKGGLADHGEAVTKLHTATHLLHAALRQVLGPHVEQRGSNITSERLRFDFTHDKKMTAEQIKDVENWVNDKIRKNLRVTSRETTVEEAKSQGAIGLFTSKYGDKVKVYTIEGASSEICGGPHAENTGTLGKFFIMKEEASSSGIRRIKAKLE
ncbi:MAG: alanine--tRNA ligase [Patescibacteria group bacterium]|nr:alanine--tRNA ligase [Patescibacteria group bacterium]